LPKVLLRIPKAIADPIFKSLEAPEIVGDPFHGIHFEISTVDGKNVHIDAMGSDATRFQITNKALGINESFAYRFKIRTRINEPAPEGWHMEGSIILAVSDGREFVIDFDARIRLKANPIPHVLPERVNVESATVTWRWPGAGGAIGAGGGGEKGKDNDKDTDTAKGDDEKDKK